LCPATAIFGAGCANENEQRANHNGLGLLAREGA